MGSDVFISIWFKKGGHLVAMERSVLLSLDLDGTFLGNGLKANLHAIRDLDGSLQAVFCTGRDRSSAAIEVGLDLQDCPGVYANGSVVYGDGGELIHTDRIPGAVVKHVMEVLQAGVLNLALVGVVQDELLFVGDAEAIEQHSKENPGNYIQVDCDRLLEAPVHLLYVVGPGVSARFGGLVLDGVRTSDLSEVSVVVFQQAGSTKATGLQRLVQATQRQSEDVVHVGDGSNDIAVFNMFRGVSMANGIPRAKLTASHFTSSNDDDPPGVVVVIRAIYQAKGVLSRWSGVSDLVKYVSDNVDTVADYENVCGNTVTS